MWTRLLRERAVIRGATLDVDLAAVGRPVQAAGSPTGRRWPTSGRAWRATMSRVADREFEMRTFADPAELDAWLAEHGADTPGLYVRLAKKGADFPSVDWPLLVEGLLCHGWIDGRANRLDETSYTIRVTPRRPKGIWSAKNVATVAELTAAGRMRPAGLAQVAAAQADGRWAAAYAGPATMAVPDDLATALDAAGARAAFDALDGQSRYAVCHRVVTKRTAAGRAGTIADLVGRVVAGKPI